MAALPGDRIAEVKMLSVCVGRCSGRGNKKILTLSSVIRFFAVTLHPILQTYISDYKNQQDIWQQTI